MDRSTARGVLSAGIAALLFVLAAPAEAQFPPDCSTPRRATQTFIENLQPERYYPKKAIACFEFGDRVSEGPARTQVAIRLKAVLDARSHFVYFDRIPDDPEHLDDTNQHRVVMFPDALPDVVIVKRNGEWLFAAGTIAATPRLHEATFSLDLDGFSKRLPAVFQRSVLGTRVWQWCSLVLLILMALIIARILHTVLASMLKRFLAKRKITLLEGVIDEKMTGPMTILLTTGMLAPLIPELGLPVRFSMVLKVAMSVAATAAVVVIAYRLIDTASGVMASRASKTDTRLDDQLVPLVRKSLKAALTVIGIIFVLQNLDVDVGSLLAGLGLGGLAFALAAKDTLANFFGSIMIFVDRPFQIGDWIKVGEVEGTVEEVGFRSTRVRTFYSSVMTVPNSTVANAIIDNLGEREYRRLKMTLGLTYDTPPAKVQAFVEGIRAILHANEGVWDQPSNVYFYNCGASSLEILVYTFLDVSNWGEELRVRHNLLLEFLRLSQALGVSMAFPTQTLHIDSSPQHPQRAHEPTSEAELAALVKSFGPDGDRARPEGSPLTDYFGQPETTARGDSE